MTAVIDRVPPITTTYRGPIPTINLYNATQRCFDAGFPEDCLVARATHAEHKVVPEFDASVPLVVSVAAVALLLSRVVPRSRAAHRDALIRSPA